MSEKVKRYIPNGFGHSMRELTDDDSCWTVGYVRVEDYLSAEKERDEWKRKYESDSVCEIGASNLRVASYCGHWEGRAERAEAELRSLRLSSIPVEVLLRWMKTTARKLNADNERSDATMLFRLDKMLTLRSRSTNTKGEHNGS